MIRRTFIITANQSSFVLQNIIRFRKAKVVKFRLIPDNINTNCICINISGLSENNILSTTGIYTSYFFMIPFVNNNSAPSYTNDVSDTWDVSYEYDKILNRADISITNENGALLTLNNSQIVMEILFEL